MPVNLRSREVEMREIELNNKEVSQIIDILQADAKTQPCDIAKMLVMDESYVAGIIEKLENEKVIIKYCAIVNTERMDTDMTEALIEVKVDPQRDRGYDEIAARIYKFPEVKSVYLMSGTYDLAVTLNNATVRQISKFVFEKLAVIDGVRSTATHFIMRKYKESGVILTEDETDDRLVVMP